MPGLIRDTFRLLWDALYWNTRKSWHIVRGRRGRCPCQVASDSGRANETGCEAIIDYASPARFRRVCPLLTLRANGDWKCSVNSVHIRPFWGRAALLLGGGALAFLLVISLAAFALLRGIGYNISYRQIIWPPAWSEFSQAQADFYRQRAIAALAEGNLAESLLLLSNAYELDPSHYPTGIQLAQLWQTNQPALSDHTYARLLSEHPEHSQDTAQAWLRALIARGDFLAVQRLAGERLLHSGPTPSSAWTQAFLFSTRQINDPAGLDVLLAEPELPPAVTALLRIERELYAQPTARRIDILTTAASDARDPFAAFHWLNYLLEEGRADLVIPRLAAADSFLGNREKLRLQLDALAVGGNAAERASLIARLLERPTEPAVCELLSGHLIANPDPVLLAAYAAKLARDPLPAGDARYPQLLAFFATCGVQRDDALMRTTANWISAAIGREFRILTPTREAFLRLPAGARLENILVALQPMPFDTLYALYARIVPPHPFPL